LGASEFENRFSAVVVYVAFPQQVDRRFMEQMALAALVDITKTEVLKASRAALRIQEMDEAKVREVLSDEDAEQNFENVLDNDVLKLKGVRAEELDEAVYDRLLKADVGQGSAPSEIS